MDLLTILTFITILLSQPITPLKIFLLGGDVTYLQPDVYIAMANATGKIAQPNNCSQDWQATTCPRVAVVTSAAQNQEEGNYYYNVDEPPHTLCFKNLFNKFGLSPKHVSVHRDNYHRTTNISLPEGQHNYELLRDADLIFFDGGDQIRHSTCWLTPEGKPIPMFQFMIDRFMGDKVIIGGTSAGTMIWSNPAYGGGSSFGHIYYSRSAGLAPKKISDGEVGGTGLHDVRNGTSGLQYEENGGMFQGFGFLPFLLDTHFDLRGRLGRIVPALMQTKHELGIGIDEPACLYYDNGIGKVFGKGGVFIADISKAIGNQKQYFSLNNVQVSYLTVGDTFIFSNRTLLPSPSKHPISQPQHKSHFDSSNIFSSYECTQLLTRLVDQTPLYNVGSTQKPKGFPSTTPTFKLTFERGYMTKGYYSTTEKVYAVERALVHFSYQ